MVSSGQGQPGQVDAGLTDRQLDTRLNSELAAVRQEPSPDSLWADAFGRTSPQLDLGGGSGGGYSFDPQQIDDAVKQWQDILQRAQSYDERIHVITMVMSAAEDEASTGFTNQARMLGGNVQACHGTLKAYATAYIAKLRAAQENYVGTEEAVRSSMQSGNETR